MTVFRKPVKNAGKENINLKTRKLQKQENKTGNGSVLPVSQSQTPFLFTSILKESTLLGKIFQTRQASCKAQLFSCALPVFGKQYGETKANENSKTQEIIFA
ncbi:hypothetical protein [Chryseobacterium lactis]|uniref:hypothetical protein n=1 Tax=Chryseobacterium lactis TaxID=1241981 RepID=UPI001623E55D|nr:hypothetical protein [Chryseobacterium lactis]